MYHVPVDTLKNWIYKTKKKQKNYKYEWYPDIESFEIRSKVRLIYDMFSLDISRISLLTKLSSEIISEFLKDNTANSSK